MTEQQKPETPKPDTEDKQVATDEWRGPLARSPQELKEMTLDELLDSLPLKPWDKDDPDPLVQKAIRLSSTTAPADLRADDQPAAPVERNDPTMLTPEELESLRQEAKRSSEWMKAKLAALRPSHDK